MPLNDNQRRFIALYRATTPRNATRAYEAVYTLRGEPARVAASRLLTNVNVRAEIDRLDADELRDLGVTPARLLREIARLAFADIRQLYGPDGHLKAPGELSDDIAAAVTSVESTEYLHQETEEPVLQRTRKIRLAPKEGSQKLLAQYLKLLTETVTVEHTGEVLHTWTERLSRGQAALEERRNGHAHAS